jgi:hypothetical protein
MNETKLSLSPSHPEFNNFNVIMKTDLMDNPVIAMYKYRKPDIISKRK